MLAALSRWTCEMDVNVGGATVGLIKKFLKDESAATAIEYGLIATGIAVAIIPVITGLGTKLKTTFSSISTALK